MDLKINIEMAITLQRDWYWQLMNGYSNRQGPLSMHNIASPIDESVHHQKASSSTNGTGDSPA